MKLGFLGLIGILFTGIFALIFVAFIMFKLFGRFFILFFESLIKGLYEINKWFTYDKNKNVIEKKRKKMEDEMLRKALNIKEQHEKNLQEIKTITKAALNRASYLKTNFPYSSQHLFNEFLFNFNKMSVEQIKALEDRIKKSHNDNKDNNEYSIKPYTMSDLLTQLPLQEKVNHPLKSSLYLMDSNEYVVHIHNVITKEDLIIQTSNFLDIKNYFDFDLNSRYTTNRGI